MTGGLAGLAGLGGLAHLGELIFIPCSYGFFYVSSIKKFVVSLVKDCFNYIVFKRF